MGVHQVDTGILAHVPVTYLFHFYKLMKIINSYVTEEMVVCFIIYSVRKVVIKESRLDKPTVWTPLEKA